MWGVKRVPALSPECVPALLRAAGTSCHRHSPDIPAAVMFPRCRAAPFLIRAVR